jgi:hypothetical protein
MLLRQFNWYDRRKFRSMLVYCIFWLEHSELLVLLFHVAFAILQLQASCLLISNCSCISKQESHKYTVIHVCTIFELQNFLSEHPVDLVPNFQIYNSDTRRCCICFSYFVNDVGAKVESVMQLLPNICSTLESMIKY